MTSFSIPPAPGSFDGWVDHFDEYAAAYEARAFGGAGLAHISATELRAVLDALRRFAGAGRREVLDAGAGTGRIARVLDRAGCAVTALDVSGEMLDRLSTELPHVHAVRGMLGTPLPLPDAAFDAVVCMRVLKYVDDVDGAIGELARVLRPGGIAVVEWTNGRSLARFGYPGAPVRFTDVTAAERIVRAAGLRVTRRVAGTRLPQLAWTRARTPRAARAVIALEHAVAALLGGKRSTVGARSIILVAERV